MPAVFQMTSEGKTTEYWLVMNSDLLTLLRQNNRTDKMEQDNLGDIFTGNSSTSIPQD